MQIEFETDVGRVYASEGFIHSLFRASGVVLAPFNFDGFKTVIADETTGTKVANHWEKVVAKHLAVSELIMNRPNEESRDEVRREYSAFLRRYPDLVHLEGDLCVDRIKTMFDNGEILELKRVIDLLPVSTNQRVEKKRASRFFTVLVETLCKDAGFIKFDVEKSGDRFVYVGGAISFVPRADISAKKDEFFAKFLEPLGRRNGGYIVFSDDVYDPRLGDDTMAMGIYFDIIENVCNVRLYVGEDDYLLDSLKLDAMADWVKTAYKYFDRLFDISSVFFDALTHEVRIKKSDASGIRAFLKTHISRKCSGEFLDAFDENVSILQDRVYGGRNTFVSLVAVAKTMQEPIFQTVEIDREAVYDKLGVSF